MGTIASRLNLRLFLDGVEVPVIGARCTFSDGAPATAEVQIVATNAVHDILPRTLVTLFYYETYDYERTSGTVALTKLGVEDPRRWKLLFLGEVTGLAIQQQNQQRACVLSCVDPSTYWDSIRQHYINFRNAGVELFENAFMGVRLDRLKHFDVVTKDAHSNLFVWLSQSKVKTGKTETKLAGYRHTMSGKTISVDEYNSLATAELSSDEQHVLSQGAVKTTSVTEDGESASDYAPYYAEVDEEYSNLYVGIQRMLREMFFASNLFYAKAFNRLRLGDMLVGLPEDKTAAKLMKLDYFEKFIKGQVGGAGGYVTARQLIQLMLGTVFHTYTAVPCPKFDPEGTSRGMTMSVEQDAHLLKEILPRYTRPGATLNYQLIKPDAWFLAPPACNVILPHQINSLAYQRNFLQEPTRLFMRTSLLFTGTNKWLTERFYAPDFAAFDVQMYDKGGFNERMASTLLPHEKWIGIAPIEHWQHDLQAYVAKGPRREYLAHLADYLFWKQRFAPRTANVALPFTPDLVVGYPGVVVTETGRVGTAGRHIIGHMQTLVHSITQQGGWTHVTMQGCRNHDETADFDAEKRTLEELTSRGADGFLDDRYDVGRIGQEVYQPIFGCDSLVDAVTTDDLTEEIEQTILTDLQFLLDTEDSPLAASVVALQVLYRSAVRAKLDINAFTRSLTHRPKANMVEVIGLPTTQGATIEMEQMILSQSGEVEGFHSIAVDVDASDHSYDQYTTTRYENVSEVKHTPAVMEEQIFPDGGVISVEEVEVEKAKTEKVTYTREINETATYGLKDDLAERQERIRLYLDSLVMRGIRG